MATYFFSFFCPHPQRVDSQLSAAGRWDVAASDSWTYRLRGRRETVDRHNPTWRGDLLRSATLLLLLLLLHAAAAGMKETCHLSTYFTRGRSSGPVEMVVVVVLVCILRVVAVVVVVVGCGEGGGLGATFL